MTTEQQREQAERIETLRNDQLLRQQQQGSTFSQFAQAEANEIGGRFGAHEKSVVVGSTPVPDYPAAFQQHDPVPVEPPLGISVDEMIPVGEAHEVATSLERLGATGRLDGPSDGGAVEAPLSDPQLNAEPAAPSTSNTDNSNDEPPEVA